MLKSRLLPPIYKVSKNDVCTVRLIHAFFKARLGDDEKMINYLVLLSSISESRCTIGSISQLKLDFLMGQHKTKYSDACTSIYHFNEHI